MVAAGQGFSLALRSDGTVLAWGDQARGNLGNDVVLESSQRVPQPVIGLARIKQIAAGQFHALALRDDGVVFAWGLNDEGRLGLGSAGGTFARPQAVPGVSNATAVAAGLRHSLVLLADGRVLAWGDNLNGQLGVGDFSGRAGAAAVNGITQARSIAAGGFHSAAVLADGTVQMWGNNLDGQLGLGDKVTRNSPASVAALAGRGITHLGLGNFHTLARGNDGSVWAWGANVIGQIGPVAPTAGGNGDTLLPQRISELSGASTVVAGQEHSVVLLADGTVRSWGLNRSGQLGNGRSGITSSTSEPQVLQASTVKAIAAGKEHTLLIVAGGIVGCTGTNFFSECGRGDFNDLTSIPVEVGPGFDAEP